MENPTSPVPAAASPRALRLEDALEILRRHPREPLAQYVALMLARRAGRLGEVAPRVRSAVAGPRGRPGAAIAPDLLSVTSGAIAVHECLQLEAMAVAEEDLQPLEDGADSAPKSADVDLASLSGPKVRSHPFAEMPKTEAAAIPPLLARCPADQWAAAFPQARMLERAVPLVKRALAGLAPGAYEETAAGSAACARVLEQLGLQADDLAAAAGALAITGNDVFFREGTDVTVLVDPAADPTLGALLDRAAARQSRVPGIETRLEAHREVPILSVRTPDDRVGAWFARAGGLAVASTSRTGLVRTLDGVLGRVPSLGQTDEVRVMRRLLPASGDELGFVYLSDPFIRRLVSPRTKLIERRRLVCSARLAMMRHALALYTAEHGAVAGVPGLDELERARAAPGRFGAGRLACPDGGAYSFDKAGTPRCTVHGSFGRLTPCVELTLERVHEAEAAEYRRFLENYEAMWSRWFDPIGIRLAGDERRVRAETVVLPLVETSLYRGLCETFAGVAPTAAATAGEVPGSVFSVSLVLDKPRLLARVPRELDRFLTAAGRGRLSAAAGGAEVGEIPDVRAFLERGLADRVSLHVLDAEAMFDLDHGALLGRLAASLGAGVIKHAAQFALIGGAISALQAPVCVRLPLADETVARTFLRQCEAALGPLAPSIGGALGPDRFALRVGRFTQDGRGEVGALSLGFLGFSFRLFAAIRDGALLIATDPRALQPTTPAAAEAPGDPAHLSVRVAPAAAVRGAPRRRLAVSELARDACLRGRDEACVRAWLGIGSTAPLACPTGGTIHLDEPGVRCSVHGTRVAPRAPLEPPADPQGATLEEIRAGLRLDPDGVYAVIELRR